MQRQAGKFRSCSGAVQRAGFKRRRCQGHESEQGMNELANSKWIHDWNLASTPAIPPGTRVLLTDETLRDGLQNPSVHDPSIEGKIEILHLMESLGIDSPNIGPPGAGR